MSLFPAGRHRPRAGRTRRRLVDGREFDIVKRHWRPRTLEAELADLGWHAEATETAWKFLVAVARPT
jgi:hypothetical protein